MSDDEFNHESQSPTFQVLLIGSIGVGKSCLLLRFAEGKFIENYESSLSVDFRQRKVNVEDGNTQVKLQVWDTASNITKTMDNVLKSRYKQSDCIVMVYDITNKESYDAITNEWIGGVEQHCEPDVCKVIVGSKCDLADKRQVPVTDGQKLAEKYGASFIETSSKTDTNIEKLFSSIGTACLTRYLLKNKDKQKHWQTTKKRCIIS